MRSLFDMAPDEILRELFAERRRREAPPSLAGIEPDQPKERKPSSGRYEELILLTRGCSPLAIRILYEASGAYTLASWRCPVHDCHQLVAHEHREVMGNDGKALMSGGVAITEPVCLAVSAGSISMRWGIHPKTMKGMVADVLTQISENIGKRRAATQVDTSNPTDEDLMTLARRVLG